MLLQEHVTTHIGLHKWRGDFSFSQCICSLFCLRKRPGWGTHSCSGQSVPPHFHSKEFLCDVLCKSCRVMKKCLSGSGTRWTFPCFKLAFHTLTVVLLMSTLLSPRRHLPFWVQVKLYTWDNVLGAFLKHFVVFNPIWISCLAATYVAFFVLFIICLKWFRILDQYILNRWTFKLNVAFKTKCLQFL